MTANHYDTVPYHSHPFAKSRPEYLFAIARLFGLAPAPWRRARVLELGCGGGGNLIPLAYNCPDGTFVGIDLSAVQLATGQRLIDALGLANIALHQMSIADVGPDLGTFDYIICHGVWSWVDAPLRDKILSVCARHLAPQGVAYVSYNCRPGWNMVQSIRDMMRYHVAQMTDPAERAEQARTMLRFILDANAQGDSAYGAYLRSELEMLAEHQDAYLLHDHLETVNHPVYFHEFMAQAEAHGLAYLAEADLQLMYVDNLAPPVAQVIGRIRDIVRAEQYMDFIRNRRFRCTLLCREDQPINRHLSADDIEPFHLSTTARPETAMQPAALEDGVPLRFVSADHVVTLHGRVPKTAMWILSEQRRRPMAYIDLLEATLVRTGIEHPEYIRQQLNNELNLLRLAFSGLIQLGVAAPGYTGQVATCPLAYGLARAQAASQAVVTNMRHEAVGLNEAERLLIERLDGRTPLADLRRYLATHVQRGDLVLEEDDRPLTAAADIDAALELLVGTMLDDLAGNALLVDPPAATGAQAPC